MSSCSSIWWGEAPERLGNFSGGLSFCGRKRVAGPIDAPSRCPAPYHGSAGVFVQTAQVGTIKFSTLRIRRVVREPRPKDERELIPTGPHFYALRHSDLFVISSL